MTSEMAVVASPWKPFTTSGVGRGMSSRMACAGSVMASLREFEEKPGAARAGDGGGQRPVREHDVEAGQREPLEPGVGELGGEAEVSARIPKSRTRLQTRSPMTSEQRKQPRRKSVSEPGPAPMKSNPNAQ